MSFLGDIISFVTGGFSKVFDIGKTIIGGANDVLQATGISSLLAIITTLTTNIDGLVNATSGVLRGIIDPITSVVTSVNGLAQDIQNKIISPLVTPITTTITEIKGLTGSISKLVDEGIGGIIKIPGAIADALGGISGSFDRSSRILAESNNKTVSETMIPGFAGILTPGLGAIAEGIVKFSTPKGLTIDQLPTLELVGNPDLESISKLIAKYTEKFKNPTTIWDHVGAVALDLVSFAPLILGYLESQYDEAVEAGRAANPVTTLPVGDVLALYQRRVIDGGTAASELRKYGYDESRTKALLTGTAFLPALDRLGDWFRRGLIDKAQFDKVLATYGVEGDQFAAFLSEQSALISPSILVDWLARSIIDQTAFDDQMRAQGHDKARILQFIKGAITPPRMGTAIYAKANELAGQFGWFSNTYASAPPDDVKQAGHLNREDEAEIYAQWAAHWSVMPIGTAVALFFRGELTRDEVKVVVAQNNFPPEMVDLLIKAQSPTIPPRSVPGLLESGTIDEVKAKELLKDKGFNDEDADLLITNALAGIASKAKPTQTDASKLTLAQLKAAYLDNVIDRDTYSNLLATHGLTGGDLEITLALADYDLLTQTKKDISDTIKAEVQLGVKTVDEGIQALFDAGFTGPEVEKLAVTLQNTKRTSAKLPSLSDIGKMFKKSLIDADVLLAGIQALGYAAPWDSLLAALITGGDTADGATTEPSPTA